ncbi:MAG: response regulator [Clostridiaceae bacterium]|nr:response regulator [Clostridiaceae bacterium]
MLKVLIIDDEKPVREAICILGDWPGLGVDSLQEAGNGREGIQQVMTGQPDIVLVDMKMPEVNGLQFLQWLEAEKPELTCIVISGYSDYDFTRQAIRSRVVDYLIKPINRESLNQALRKAVDEVAERRGKQGSMGQTGNRLSEEEQKRRFLQSIFEGSYDLRIQNMYGGFLNQEHSCTYHLVLIRILNLRMVKSLHFGNDSNLLFFVISNVIQEIAGARGSCLCMQNPGNDQEIIGVVTSLDQVEYPELRNTARRILTSLQDYLSIQALAVLSRPDSQILNLGPSLRKARQILAAQNLLNLQQISDLESFSPDTPDVPELSIISRQALLRQGVESGQFEQVRLVLLDFFVSVRATGRFSLAAADRIRSELMYLLNSLAVDKGVPSRQLSEDEALAAELAYLHFDYSSMQNYENMLMNLAGYYFNCIRHHLHQFDIQDIRLFLERNYAGDISVTELAQQHFLSRGYLMKLFKQKYGLGIYEYLQQVRMEKARVLLGDLNIKIQSVAGMVGYKDQNYFSKAFRHTFSLSPSEYRLEQQHRSQTKQETILPVI